MGCSNSNAVEENNTRVNKVSAPSQKPQEPVNPYEFKKAETKNVKSQQTKKKNPFFPSAEEEMEKEDA